VKPPDQLEDPRSATAAAAPIRVPLTFARSIGEFGAVLVVNGGISRLTESSTLFIFRSLDDRNYVGAYAMALVLVVISLSVVGAMEIFKKRTTRHE
jgi:sulfate transport system permease protein